MKKTKLLLAFFCLLLLFTTYSCQVEELDPTPTAITDNGTAKKINPLFLTHKFSDRMIKPLWKSAITFENVDAVEVNFSIDKKFYRPLSENKKVVGRQRILLTFDKEGKVKETFIEYIPSNNFSGDIKKINSGNFKNQFEGKVTFRNPNKEVKVARIVSNTKIIQKTTLTKTKPLGNVTTSKTSGEICITNYECTTYSLGFQDPALGEVFVDAQNECWWETICYNDPYLDTNPETPAEIDPYSCSVNPNTPWCNGGGQDPNDPEDECPINETAFNNSVDAIQITDDLESVNTTSESGGYYEKFYTWKCLKNTTMNVKSTEIAKINVSTNEFVSLTHSHASPEGFLINGTYDITSDVGIGTVGRFNAVMELSIGITASFTCKGQDFTRYMNFNPVKHFSN